MSYSDFINVLKNNEIDKIYIINDVFNFWYQNQLII